MRRRRRRLRRLDGRAAVALALVIALALLAGRMLPQPARPAPGAPPVTAPVGATVTRVYDGDTIEAAGWGKVRLIGIDTLDGYEARRTKEQAKLYGMTLAQVRYWAEQASDFARGELLGHTVRLEGGPEEQDRYGRALAYVAVTGEGGREVDFNLDLIRRGLAAAYYSTRHPRGEAYERAQAEAAGARRGFWQDARRRP